eukprot:m.35599 g.35599  ORF g.35599 m.35599 type:complete len:1307 (+) comp14422_c0_seq1:472-4392(+)
MASLPESKVDTPPQVLACDNDAAVPDASVVTVAAALQDGAVVSSDVVLGELKEQNAPQIKLKKYLMGHVLHKAMSIFENAIGKFVKSTMRRSFPDMYSHSLDIIVKQDPYALEFYINKRKEWEKNEEEKRKIRVKIEHLKNKVDNSSIHLGERTKIQNKICEQQKGLSQLEQRGVDSAMEQPTPRWLRKSQAALSVNLKHTCTEHAIWDTLLLVRIINCYMHDIFEPVLTTGDSSTHEAKELVNCILNVAEVRNSRAHDSGLSELNTESILVTIHHLYKVADRCQQADAREGGSKDVNKKDVEHLGSLLCETQEWMEKVKELHLIATTDKPILLLPTVMSPDDYSVQVLYENLCAWEQFMSTAVGPFEYRAQSIKFTSSEITKKNERVLHSLNQELALITDARNWYFHRTASRPNLKNIHQAMLSVAKKFDELYENSIAFDPIEMHPHLVQSESELPGASASQLAVQVVVEPVSTSMNIPMVRVHSMFGREAIIEKVICWVCDTNSPRILLHGVAGVGKDAVISEVVHDPRVITLAGLQGWIQCSSSDLFKRQLLNIFKVHQPHVVNESKHNLDRALEAIHKWLSQTSQWILVLEDVCSNDIWDIVPKQGTGRVLVSSQQSLHLQDTTGMFSHTLELPVLSEEDSVALFLSRKPFSARMQACQEISQLSATDLQTRCDASGVTFQECGAGTGTSSGKGHGMRKDTQRRKQLAVELYTAEQVEGGGLRAFLADQLGNLPLCVVMCSNMLRHNPELESITDLTKHFEKFQLAAVSSHELGPHYLGLSFSLQLQINRLIKMKSADHDPRVQNMISLLIAVSLLDRGSVPSDLFVGSVADVEKTMHEVRHNERCPHCNSCSEEMLRHILSVFTNKAEFDIALSLLEEFGMLRRSTKGTSILGVMHQLVQRCVMEFGVASLQFETHVVSIFVGNALNNKFGSTDVFSPTLEKDHNLTTCASVFILNHMRDNLASVATCSPVVLLGTEYAKYIFKIEGSTVKSQEFTEKILKYAESRHSDLHPQVAALQSCLASVYNDLGRHADALVLQRKALHAFELLLPEDHPFISTSMNNLAFTYKALDRYEDVLELECQALGLKKSIYPEGHREIVLSKNNLATTYCELGQHEKALPLLQETLAGFEQVLPEDHPHTATVMANLAHTYGCMGRHQEALKLNESTLALRRRILSPSHPDIAVSMNNLASCYSELNRHEDAMRLETETLAMRERILPENHPDIALSMSNLAWTYSALGRHRDAIELATKSLQFRKRVLPGTHADIATLNILAKAYAAEGQREKALQYHKQMLSIMLPGFK